MLFSTSVLFLIIITAAGTCMYVVAGWLALDGTLELFKLYGPTKDSGNPALDNPPTYYVHANTGKWAPVNPDNRGNLVPQVFEGVQKYLIALAILMIISFAIILTDNMWGKKAAENRNYVGKKSSRNSWSCNTWLTGYLALLSLMWLVMACFGVVPLVEWVITKQRCKDLDNPHWSDGTSQVICIDLVQYGLVFFKETQNPGFAMICGPGGRYNTPRGNLKGFCDNYYPNYSLYLTSYIGACITLIAVVLLFTRYVSQFGYLKYAEWENEATHPKSHNPHMGPPNGYIDQRVAYGNYGNSMHNPNYEHNMLLMNPHQVPSHVDVESYGRRSSPGTEAIEMKERYYDSGDRGSRKNGKKGGSRSYTPDDPGTFQRQTKIQDPEKKMPPLSDDSVETPHRRDYASDVSSKRPQSRSTAKRRPQASSESDDSSKKPLRIGSKDHGDASDHSRSTVSFRPKPLKRKARGTKSDPDISRKSGRHSARRMPSKRVEEEYDSPPSDYYLQQDMTRQLTSKRKNRSGSAY